MLIITIHDKNKRKEKWMPQNNGNKMIIISKSQSDTVSISLYRECVKTKTKMNVHTQYYHALCV